ncbi:2-hydroxyacid dehydrogenase [Salinibacillus xinjiangensis]|uniref:D-glycerate dehydrogenase n=1 Tax=Salinibacillus xinjiangensis TaxID=1229268 RepID=A0A6G1X2N4_9BACI|nr:D-glycerate dehydrogenase [Salinibacillus xinjiangensis]MRG85179.1 D-glycerate dehydrogenase [Salinibacillus xinjiangensis]
MKPKIFITRKIAEEFVKPYREHWDVEMWHEEGTTVDRQVLLEKASQADALITMLSDAIDQEVIDAGVNLNVISNLAVGYDNIDVDYAKEKGITVTNTPDVLTETTADLTFSLLMATARRIIEANQYVKEGKWTNWAPFLMAGTDIHHKTIGIVGMGRIGEAIAERARGFNMNILYHNRSRKERAEKEIGATYTSFDELIETSDYVVCMTPLTEDTVDMFNESVFKRMKNSAIFINTSRGGVVNENDLYTALETKEIRAAGLDVFQNEPIGQDHPLLQLENVTALPHIGSASYETRSTMIELCLQNIQQVLAGKEPATPVL